MRDSDRSNAHTSRFAEWTPVQAAASLAGFLALLLWGLIAGTNLPDNYQSTDHSVTNVALYNAVVDKMMAGEGYYRAIDESQAVRGFPTRPFPTVREPGLATVESWLGGNRPMGFVLLGLLSLTLLAMLIRLERVAQDHLTWWFASILCVVSPLLFFNTEAVDLHEYWAGLLLMLALAVQSASRWRAGIVIALLAVLVRELALPLLAAMAVYEFMVGRRRRAGAWVAAATGFAVLLAVHARAVEHGVAPAEIQSPGWIKFGGWPFFVDSVRYTSVLGAMPVWVAAVVVPLALLGWLSRRGDFANRVTLVLFAFATAFLFVGRPGNFYWGFLFVGVLMPGLAFAPSALGALCRTFARNAPRPVDALAHED